MIYGDFKEVDKFSSLEKALEKIRKIGDDIMNNLNNINLIFNVIDKDGDYHPCVIDKNGNFIDIYYDNSKITGLSKEKIEEKGYKIKKEENLDKIEKYNLAYKRKKYLNKQNI